MSDLDEKQQKHVRTALRILRQRSGTWAAVTRALHLSLVPIDKVMNGQRAVTPSTAFRVPRFLDVPVDDLLAGRFLPPGACPRCGHVPTSPMSTHSPRRRRAFPRR